MEEKPQISWNHQKERFEIGGEPISQDEALAHWDACDAEWTMGAYNRMIDLTLS